MPHQLNPGKMWLVQLVHCYVTFLLCKEILKWNGLGVRPADSTKRRMSRKPARAWPLLYLKSKWRFPGFRRYHWSLAGTMLKQVDFIVFCKCLSLVKYCRNSIGCASFLKLRKGKVLACWIRPQKLTAGLRESPKWRFGTWDKLLFQGSVWRLMVIFQASKLVYKFVWEL